MRAAVLALTVLLMASCAHQPPRMYPHAALQAVPPKLVPPVRLLDAKGSYYLDALKGRWVWLFFGYGSCPDVCPTTLGYLASAYGKLANPGKVQVVFVSVDPARDTPAKLAQMTSFFNQAFVGVTGDAGQLSQLAGAVGAAYRRDAEPAKDGSYTISHSNQVYVLDPEGRQVATYQPDADPAAMAKDFDQL